MSEQHLKRSKELSLLKGKSFKIENNHSNNNSNNSVSLASARGIQFENLSMISNEEMDPITKFQIQVYNLIKSPNLTNNNLIETDSEIKKSGKSIEELEIENQMLKKLIVNYSENLQIYESFHKKVKMNLKNYLNSLKADLKLIELNNKKEIDNLNKENKKLELQIKKLKQRWDELVKSAKKRRDSSGT